MTEITVLIEEHFICSLEINMLPSNELQIKSLLLQLKY